MWTYSPQTRIAPPSPGCHGGAIAGPLLYIFARRHHNSRNAWPLTCVFPLLNSSFGRRGVSPTRYPHHTTFTWRFTLDRTLIKCLICADFLWHIYLYNLGTFNTLKTRQCLLGKDNNHASIQNLETEQCHRLCLWTELVLKAKRERTKRKGTEEFRRIVLWSNKLV